MFNSVLQNDEEQLYVKDYAGFLYRGLEKDIENFRRLFLDRREREGLVEVEVARLEVNTLEIVYQKQEYKWIIEKDKFLDNMGDELDLDTAEDGDTQQNE